jgi:hypothetical protein
MEFQAIDGDGAIGSIAGSEPNERGKSVRRDDECPFSGQSWLVGKRGEWG